MTTQNTSSSPFQDIHKSEKSSVNPSSFSIHTMKDDLLSIQKEDSLIPEKISEPGTDFPLENMQKKSTPNPFSEPTESTDLATELPITKNTNSTPDPFEEKEHLLVEVAPVTDTLPTSSASAGYKIVLSIISVLIFSVLALGGYYFFMTRTPQPDPIEIPVVIAEPVLEPEPVTIVSAPEEKYSTEKPNYLVLDLATMDAAAIKKSIVDLTEELKTIESQQSLYEFIVVDSNNNPVSFPIFAIATGLKFSPALLESLDKTFSLFIYNDNRSFRIGLSIQTLETTKLALEIQKQQITMVKDLGFLFLGEALENNANKFSSTTFKGVVINYINDIDPAKKISVDYALTQKHLVVSTSKLAQESIMTSVLSLPVKEVGVEEIIEPSSTEISTPDSEELIIEN